MQFYANRKWTLLPLLQKSLRLLLQPLDVLLTAVVGVGGVVVRVVAAVLTVVVDEAVVLVQVFILVGGGLLLGPRVVC